MSKLYRASQARMRVKSFFSEMVPDSATKQFSIVSQEKYPELLKEIKELKDKLQVEDEYSSLEFSKICDEYVEKSRSLIIKVSLDLITRAATAKNL